MFCAGWLGNNEFDSVVDIELLLRRTVLNDLNLIAHHTAVHHEAQPIGIEFSLSNQHHRCAVASFTLRRNNCGDAWGSNADRDQVTCLQTSLLIALAVFRGNPARGYVINSALGYVAAIDERKSLVAKVFRGIHHDAYCLLRRNSF